MKTLTRVTQKGQVTIPKEVRDALRLQTGDTVYFELKDGNATIQPLAPIDALFGMFTEKAKRPVNEEDEKEIIKQAVIDRFKKKNAQEIVLEKKPGDQYARRS
jgi:AbrB family looped-hinge helix DNA binding protein